MMSQGYSQPSPECGKFYSDMRSSFLYQSMAFKKNGECYRLGDTPRKSTCDPWLDPDSNKPTVKERVLRQVETPEHKHGVR